MIDPISIAAGASIAAAAGAFGTRRKRRNRAMVRRATPPETLSIEAAQTRIMMMHYNAQSLELVEEPTLDQIAVQAADPHRVSWVHVSGLGDAARIEALGTRMGFHRLLLEDIIHVGHRPKLEHYDALLFVIMRMAPVKPRDELDQCAMVLHGNCLFTFDERHGDCFDGVRARLRAGSQLRDLKASQLMLALMDAIVDAYFPVLELEGDALDSIEDQAMQPRARSVIAATTEIKRRLLSYRRALWPTRELMGALLRETGAHVPDDGKPYARDIHDHVIELVDLVEMLRETATSLSELHLAIASARLNDVMRFLTIISTLFMPLSFIAGVYGMNFVHMPELKIAWAYPAVLLFMALVAMGFLIFFRRNGMLGPPGTDPALRTKREPEQP
jgi:magnesium transporter